MMNGYGIYSGVVGLIFNIMLVAGVIGCFYGVLVQRKLYAHQVGDMEVKIALEQFHKNDSYMDLLHFILMIWITAINWKYGYVWIMPVVGFMDKNEFFCKSYWRYLIFNCLGYAVFVVVFGCALVNFGFISGMVKSI